jgi:hypothetical protein
MQMDITGGSAENLGWLLWNDLIEDFQFFESLLHTQGRGIQISTTPQKA